MECRLARALAMLTDRRCLHLPSSILSLPRALAMPLISIACSAGASATRHRACGLQRSRRHGSDPAAMLQWSCTITAKSCPSGMLTLHSARDRRTILKVFTIGFMVAVGTRIAPRPPHRSRRALLTHRAPPSGRTWGDTRFEPARAPAHSRQSDRRGSSAQCPNHGRLSAVPLG